MIPYLLSQQLDLAQRIEMEPYTIAYRHQRYFVRVYVYSTAGKMGEHELEFSDASHLIRVLREHGFVTTKVDETGLSYERRLTVK